VAQHPGELGFALEQAQQPFGDEDRAAGKRFAISSLMRVARFSGAG
jgi:hypothetical protein